MKEVLADPAPLPPHEDTRTLRQDEDPSSTMLAPDFRLPASRIVGHYFLLFLSHPICGALSQRLELTKTASLPEGPRGVTVPRGLWDTSWVVKLIALQKGSGEGKGL